MTTFTNIPPNSFAPDPAPRVTRVAPCVGGPLDLRLQRWPVVVETLTVPYLKQRADATEDAQYALYILKKNGINPAHGWYWEFQK